MAAGLGFKTFTTGEVLTAADTNGYLMQGVLVFASAAARDAAITSPQEGQFAYLKDTNVTTYYTGSAWANLDTTGMTNPMTTTGDTIYSSSGSTPARLGIGSTGQVLTVASGLPSWATPAAGGGYTLLTSGSFPAASSVTLSSISQSYKNLRLILKKIQNTTDAENFNLRFNGITTATYAWLTDFSTGASAFSQTSIRLLSNIDNTVQDGMTIIDIPDYTNSTTYKQIACLGFNTNTLTTSSQINSMRGGSSATTAITSLTIIGEGGSNFDAGTYELYGEN